MDFAGFIKEKTPEALALACDVDINTVYSWSHRNSVPRKRWDTLIRQYRISWVRLVEMESASRLNTPA